VKEWLRSSDRIALFALVVANLTLIVLALSYRWSYYAPVLIFWCETIVIALYNVVKMFVVGIAGNPFGKWVGFDSLASAVVWTSVLVVFFVVKFGVVALGAGLLVLLLPAVLGPGTDGFAVMEALTEVAPAVATGVVLLVISHGISFVRNFVLKREYERTNALVLLVWPYARSLWIGVAILTGVVAGELIPGASCSMIFLLVLILFKLAGDVASHLHEHSRFRETDRLD
jgi:hypothetical protein